MKIGFSSTSGNNLYGIFRKRSDGTVYDAVANAWDSWLDGDIDDYDVAATDHGGDYYTIAVPDHANFDLDGDLYDMTIYKRAGASPAITDIILSSRTVIGQEDYHSADYFVDTSPTPWNTELREKATGTAIVTKTVKSTTGGNITNTTTVVGRLTKA